jgi:CBS domain-containing protein
MTGIPLRGANVAIRSIRTIVAGQTPITAVKTSSVLAAARVMKQHNIGAILVLDGSRLIGIFTERDALFRVIAEGRDPLKTRLADVMTANPRTITPDRPFAHALHLMHEGGFRHVPVVDDERRPLGVVSARDALGPELEQFVGELQDREHLGEVMR